MMPYGETTRYFVVLNLNQSGNHFMIGFPKVLDTFSDGSDTVESYFFPVPYYSLSGHMHQTLLTLFGNIFYNSPFTF